MHQISAPLPCIRRGPLPRSFILVSYGRPNFQNEMSGTLPKTSEFGTPARRHIMQQKHSGFESGAQKRFEQQNGYGG